MGVEGVEGEGQLYPKQEKGVMASTKQLKSYSIFKVFFSFPLFFFFFFFFSSSLPPFLLSLFMPPSLPQCILPSLLPSFLTLFPPYLLYLSSIHTLLSSSPFLPFFLTSLFFSLFTSSCYGSFPLSLSLFLPSFYPSLPLSLKRLFLFFFIFIYFLS